MPENKTTLHYYTMPHFEALKIYSCRKHCDKRRNCLFQAISPFLTMFSTLYGTYFSFQIHIKMLCAICFILRQSKILSSGNEIILFIHLRQYNFRQIKNRKFCVQEIDLLPYGKYLLPYGKYDYHMVQKILNKGEKFIFFSPQSFQYHSKETFVAYTFKKHS